MRLIRVCPGTVLPPGYTLVLPLMNGRVIVGNMDTLEDLGGFSSMVDVS
jgi:hypothetical protein